MSEHQKGGPAPIDGITDEDMAALTGISRAVSDLVFRETEDVLPDWHGWRKGAKSMHVGPLPGRKQFCLYMEDRSVIRPLAYFRTEEHAREALMFLDRLARG